MQKNFDLVIVGQGSAAFAAAIKANAFRINQACCTSVLQGRKQAKLLYGVRKNEFD